MKSEIDTSWVRSMLHPGENLLWTGRPEKLRLFEIGDISDLLFFLLYFGSYILLVWKIWTDSESGSSKFLTVAVGLNVISMLIKLFVERLMMRKYRYALTNQRIILNEGKTCKSLILTELPRMTVNQRKDGSGDICFGEGWFRSKPHSPRSHAGYTTYIAVLWGIPDVNQVEYRIRTTVDQVRAACRND